MCIQDLLPCALLTMKMSHVSFIQLQLLFKIKNKQNKINNNKKKDFSSFEKYSFWYISEFTENTCAILQGKKNNNKINILDLQEIDRQNAT